VSTDQPSDSIRRRRNNRSPEFKAKIVAACMNLGVSATAIAREHGLNTNLVHRWVREYEKTQETNQAAIIDHESVDMATMIMPNFIELPFNTPAVNTESEEPIQLEFQRGDLKLNVKWPAPKASECVHLIKALLKC